MTKGKLLDYLEKMAREYRKDASASVHRNNHMNDLDGSEIIDQKVVDALLVDFVNYIGVYQGVDYGLYTYDLRLDDDMKREDFIKSKSRMN